MEVGIEKGELCNREGCTGVIEEHDTDLSCSCHINPPCSKCVDDRHYCPECNWEGIEDQNGHIGSIESNKTPEQNIRTIKDTITEDMKREIGNKYYRVEYQGSLSLYEIIEYKNGDPVYSITQLTTMKNYEYAFIENPKPFGTSNFSTDVINKDKKGWFLDFEQAKKKSYERFEYEVNPNGQYRVARYFDDIFEIYVTETLTKKEADIKAKEFNNKPRHYVSYSPVAIREIQMSKNRE